MSITNHVHEGDVLTFTIANINVSVANALRRVILSDIPTLVFRTSQQEGQIKIITNTSRFTNEVIKHRLGCIPIHLKVKEDEYKNYLLEVEVENTTDTIQIVTTADFRIKNKETNKYVDSNKLFPPFQPGDGHDYYIDFLRLRPKMTDEFVGEKIHLTCELGKGTASEDGSYNVVSTCSYGLTVDPKKQEEALEKLSQTWKDEGKNVKFETKNWLLLEGKRREFCKPDSFDFIIQSIGIYSNHEILEIACNHLLTKLKNLEELVDSMEIQIEPSSSTMANSYDIRLEDEDETIGKVVEYFFHQQYIVTDKNMVYCGFKRLHPHDNFSLVRIAFHNAVDKGTVHAFFKNILQQATATFRGIQKEIKKL